MGSRLCTGAAPYRTDIRRIERGVIFPMAQIILCHIKRAVGAFVLAGDQRCPVDPQSRGQGGATSYEAKLKTSE